MDTLTYTFVDKTKWPRGEWDAEPDKMQWQDDATGLPCLVVRGPVGALCGYVGVAEGHPLHGKSYSDDAVYDVRVHGGLTFDGPCQEREHGICHIPAPGDPDPVWWFGFDCAHGGDKAPAYDHGILSDGDYRNLAYVQNECRELAEQLKAVSK